MKKLNGIAASNGIAIAPVFKLEETVFNIKPIAAKSLEVEKQRFYQAIEQAKSEVSSLRERVAQKIDEVHAQVFDAHLQMLEDPEIIDNTIAQLEASGKIVEFHFAEVTNQVQTMFLAMDDAYMKERAADVKDIARRVLAILTNTKIADPAQINSEVIIVARDLTPSDTAALDKKFVKGFVTEIGGRTSHSAIMARSMEVPAIVGLKEILSQVKTGEQIIIDGSSGEIIINPAKEIVNNYMNLLEQQNAKKVKLQALLNKRTMTKCGHYVELAANIGSDDEIELVLKSGAEGIGLFRSEFLYMKNSSLPTEEQQFEAYSKVLNKIPQQKVIIRTLDIGGDKDLPYLKIQKEDNPFLGQRALRYCLDNIDIFTTQLRALLRANVHGNLHIMFPMVATVEEVVRAKAIVKEIELELTKTQPIKPYKIGIMIEIPAAALNAEQLIKEVDFFSIGTNDLIQYTMAADRINEKVAYLYQPFNPAVLQLIKKVIDAAHAANKWTGMCGEMAGDINASVVLLGLGLDEFSMSPSSILPLRDIISKLDLKEVQDFTKQLLMYPSHQKIVGEIEKFLKKVIVD
jgi:phosphoenolpyruvate-protein phosphotransferase (PTS system enzyme I)